MTTNTIKNIALIVLILLLAFLGNYAFNLHSNYKELEQLNEAASAELQVWKDKDGLNRGKIAVLETQNTKTFLAFQTQDSTIKELQSTVKDMQKYLKKQGSVTIIEGETKYDTIYKTTPGNNYKSLLSGFLTDSINNNWISSTFGFRLDSLPNGTFTIDSTKYSLSVKNKYSLTIGREPTGFLGLGKGKPFAEVKNFNPYTETVNLRTYQVDGYVDKKWSLGPSAIISFDGSKFIPGIGIGVTYGLVRW